MIEVHGFRFLADGAEVGGKPRRRVVSELSAQALHPRKMAGPSSKGGVDLREVTDGVFTDLARDVERCFDAVTLADVCARGEALGLTRRARPLSAAYVI